MLLPHPTLPCQVFMAIFGLTAMAFAFYGMSTVNKDVTLTAWDVVDDLGTFTANVSSQVGGGTPG